LSDDDKIAFIDSVKAARARLVAANPPAENTAPGAVRGAPGGGNRGGGGGDGGRVQIIGGGAGIPVTAGVGAGLPAGVNLNFVSPSELPDYKPAFFVGSTRADRSGNLWVRTIPTKAIAGGPVYDVINNKGELVDRVQAPVNTSIAGFGADGSVL